ncbi:MAG: 3-methyl-2-oxobutanoate hydroxymethyltransferase [Gemmatimonadales bacterium]|nr:MAG: 3-methyl-2-oxobutanoate hydroxymethyltransferase [Gemmatimonadales bacterium]
MKEEGRPIAVLTCYDALMAGILDGAGVDMILVGDSLGQVVLGHDSTLPVTVDDMIRHAGAVVRGAPHTFVVVDLPFMAARVSEEDTLRSAGRILRETGARAVKLEGGDPRAVATVRRLVEAGIPVQGHLGLTPQSVHTLGGYRVQGRGEEAARVLLESARALEDAGCFSVVLELVPGPLAREVSEALRIPVIGIGAGAHCDGQVLVLPDALGLNPGFTPRFLRRFADLHGEALRGVEAYLEAVRDGSFPGPEHTFDADSG